MRNQISSHHLSTICQNLDVTFHPYHAKWHRGILPHHFHTCHVAPFQWFYMDHIDATCAFHVTVRMSLHLYGWHLTTFYWSNRELKMPIRVTCGNLSCHHVTTLKSWWCHIFSVIFMDRPNGSIWVCTLVLPFFSYFAKTSDYDIFLIRCPLR